MDFINALRSVADDIESGALEPGRKHICEADGAPCCAIGHVLARAAGTDTIGDSHSPWYDVYRAPGAESIWGPNDAGDKPGTVAALHKVADTLAARTAA